jgi:hemoglobin
MSASVSIAEAKRLEIQVYANSIGINEDFISTFVDEFYARVRLNDVLGPVFLNAIGQDWTEHLENIKRFWSSVALNTGVYSGKPVPKHQALNGVQREFFDIWLGLFRDTLKDVGAGIDAIDYMMERAERIAASLKLAMFGILGLPGSKP